MNNKVATMPSIKPLTPAPSGAASPLQARADAARPPGPLARGLIRLDDAVGTLEDWFLVAAHAAIAGLVFVGVLVRYFLKDPLTWDQEVIVALFTWLMFIGAAAAIRHRMHIRVDLVGGLFKRPSFRFVTWINVALGAAAVVALLWSATVNFTEVLGALTPMLEMSQGVLDGALPVGLALLLLHMARILVEHGAAAVFAGELESLQ
ncbi:MAG: TRAP transporter small permease subunit [Polaromonas sp.]|nr:TRAP transporter small permease subunit [Polaromonas sp.]